MPGTLLIAEDEPVQRHILASGMSKKFGYRIITAENGKEVLATLQKSNVGEIDAVILDISMPHMDGFETLKHIRKFRPDLPVLMLTAQDGTDTAVKAIKLGAIDFMVKPPDITHLDISLKNAIKMARLSREIARLKRDQIGALAFDDLIGSAQGLKDVVAYGRKAAASDIPVLIMGDTGVGKELFARALHGESRRVGAPFVAINCGAIPHNLVESILFGHEKGAFTGASNKTLGKFRDAEGGTIFLDEIGELPLDAQVKLLRVLQQKEVEPVGGGKTVKVNVRVLSATNRDLKSEVKHGKFREDLYFRISVLPITIPLLRNRREDIIPLANHFLQKHSAADGVQLKELSVDAKEYLLGCSWPGNIRELEGLMHRAIVLCDSELIDGKQLADIHDPAQSTTNNQASSTSPPHVSLLNESGRFKTMGEIEAEAIAQSLAHHNNNISAAASALNIAKSTFYRKIKDAT